MSPANRCVGLIFARPRGDRFLFGMNREQKHRALTMVLSLIKFIQLVLVGVWGRGLKLSLVEALAWKEKWVTSHRLGERALSSFLFLMLFVFRLDHQIVFLLRNRF